MPPRKSLAKREPNGKPQRLRQVDGPSPTEITRLRDAALAGLKDPVWGTTLGWLFLAGKVSASQFAAGKRWAELARDYSAAVLAPRAPRSAALEPAGGSPVDPDSAKGAREARREVKIVGVYVAALEAIKLLGEPARRSLRNTCELGLMPAGEADLVQLRHGLDVLNAFWNGAKRK